MACYLPPHQTATSNSSSSSSSPTIATTDSMHSIVSQSKIFQTLFGTLQQHQAPSSANGETPRSFPSNAVIIDATDSRPTKQPRRLGPTTAAYYDDDFNSLLESFLPLEEFSPEVIVPESPRLSCLDESLLDVPELLLPPVCEDTPRCAPRRIGLQRVVDRRRLVDGRRRRIRSIGLAEVRQSERYLSGTKRRTRDDEDCY